MERLRKGEYSGLWSQCSLLRHVKCLLHLETGEPRAGLPNQQALSAQINIFVWYFLVCDQSSQKPRGILTPTLEFLEFQVPTPGQLV